MAAQVPQTSVIVIGGGPAGTTAALRAAALGARVILVERGRLGGTCTNDGCAPTRVLARAARLARDAELFRAYGLPAPEINVDLPQLLSHTQHTIYALQEKKQLIAHLERAGVRVLAEVGAAAFVDPHTLELGDGRRVTADRFILCAGGQGRPLPVPGGELALSHRDVWMLKRMPRSLIIIGAAATGCQLASIFNAFGVPVTILELAPRILPGEDEAVSAALAESFGRRGIDVRCGLRGISRLLPAASGVRVQVEGPAGTQSLDADAVIAAVGWVGNVDGLGLDRAGVEVARGYVVVDENLRTSQTHIFAAGDLTGRIMLVQTAQADARLAAEAAVLGATAAPAPRLVPHGGFTDPEYGSVGLTEAQARSTFGADMWVTAVPYAQVDRAIIDSRTEGFCKLVVSRQTGRVLGAHVIGEQAVEIVHVAAAAMAGGLTVGQLADLALAYPTYTAVIGQAARRAAEELTGRAGSTDWRELSGGEGRELAR